MNHSDTKELARLRRYAERQAAIVAANPADKVARRSLRAYRRRIGQMYVHELRENGFTPVICEVIERAQPQPFYVSASSHGY